MKRPRPRPAARARPAGPSTSAPGRGRRPVAPRREPPQPIASAATNVASADALARLAVEIAAEVEHAVDAEQRRADRTLSNILRGRRDLAAPDARFLSGASFALLRWRGWIVALRPQSLEEALLVAWLLDAPTVHPACRIWARVAGIDPERLMALGDAPGWPERAIGLRRLMPDRGVVTDPWRLFPDWLKPMVPAPPGDAPPKIRLANLLLDLQKRPALWVRAQGTEPDALWDELRAVGLKPWTHRRIAQAARLDREADLYRIDAFKQGRLEIQDLASQAVGIVCDPDPGERWWDACAGAGGKALDLAGRMGGKGLVVASDNNERRLAEVVRRARRSPYRNITTKAWEGRKLPAKPASFHGVLVDAPCSGLGSLRRNPDVRWTIDAAAVARLAEEQIRLLGAAAAGVRPGGTLVYSACTFTPAETTGVARAFLEAHPEFRPDPFPHPLTGAATDGSLMIWPADGDCDAMFVARFQRDARPAATDGPPPA